MNRTSLHLSLFLLALTLVVLPLQSSAQDFEMKKGDVLIKTNPFSFLYPLYNGTVEIGIADNWSLEIMGGFFPERNRSSGFYDFLTSIKGGGVVSHVMIRHYKTDVNINYFISYGLMYKQWSYRNMWVYDGNDVVTQNRVAYVPGLRSTVGFQLPMFKKRAICEMYTGLSAKVRFEYLVNRNTTEYGGPASLNREFSQLVFVPGFLLGMGIGPAFRNKKVRM
jgi:hypothetical protein